MLLRNIYLNSRKTNPSDIVLSNSSVFEYAPNNTIIGTLSTLDPNINDTFTYSIVGDVGNKFILDGNILKVNGIMINSVANTHNVTIRSTDNKDKFFDKTFTISVVSLYKPSSLGSKNNLWIDGLDTTRFLLNAGKIENVTEKSLNARIFGNPTTAQRPTLNIDGIKFFDIPTNAITCLFNESAFLFNTMGGFRLFGSVKIDSISFGAGGNLISESKGDIASANPYFSYITQSSDGGTPASRDRIGSVYRTNNSGAFLFTETATRSNIVSLSSTEFNVVAFQDNLTNVKNFSNTIESNNVDYMRLLGLTGTTRTTIGALRRDVPSLGFRGTIQHLVGTTNDLTITELQKLEGFLAWSGNSSSRLPVGHPYKNAPALE